MPFLRNIQNLLSVPPSVILGVAHRNKQETEIAKYFDAASRDVNYFLVAVVAEDHDDAHQHSEEGDADSEVNRRSDGAHRHNHRVPNHYLREVLHDLVRDALHSLLLPLFECSQLIFSHVLQLSLIFDHLRKFLCKGVLVLTLYLLLHGFLNLSLHLILAASELERWLTTPLSCFLSALLLLLLLLLIILRVILLITLIIILLLLIVLLLLVGLLLLLLTLPSVPAGLLLLHFDLLLPASSAATTTTFVVFWFEGSTTFSLVIVTVILILIYLLNLCILLVLFFPVLLLLGITCSSPLLLLLSYLLVLLLFFLILIALLILALNIDLLLFLLLSLLLLLLIFCLLIISVSVKNYGLARVRGQSQFRRA